MGSLSPEAIGLMSGNSVHFLRDVLVFFGVKFKVTPVPRDREDGPRPAGTGEVLVSCVGIGYSNVNKSMA